MPTGFGVLLPNFEVSESTMSWPTPQEYNEAIQNPAACFADPELARGTTVVNVLGLPRVATGNFASVYKVESSERSWAVRCFLSNRVGQELRYQTISDFVLFDDLECTVDFYYLKQGIKVAGEWYPLLKMPWIEGQLLDQFVMKNISRPQTMLDLARKFYRLVRELEVNEVAHGDLQHGNIIVTPDGLRLVDYDALYVPGLAGFISLELGHPNYQHPGRDEKHFDPTVDNFSTWLIYASLLCLAIDPSIYSLFESGDECLIFKRKDLTAPEKSIVFQTLLGHESTEIRGLTKLLSRLLWLEPPAVPPLELPDLEKLNLDDVNNLIQSASKPVLSGSPQLGLASQSHQQPNLVELDEIDSEILDILTNTANHSFLSGKKTSRRLPLVQALVTKTRKQMEKILDRALRKLSPQRRLRMIVSEADRLVRSGDYEKALELYKSIHSDLDTVPAYEQMNLVLKRGRCHLLLDQPDLARNFFVFGACLIETETSSTVSRSTDLIEKKRVFFSCLASKEKENEKKTLAALNELIAYHRTIYYQPSKQYEPGAGSEQGVGALAVRIGGANEPGRFYYDPKDYLRIDCFADELEDIFDFLQIASDVLGSTKSWEWRKHLTSVLELFWLWRNGDYDIPKKSPRTRQCLNKIFDYSDAIVATKLSDDTRQALILAMMRSIANRSLVSSQLLDCLKKCSTEQAEQAFVELNQRASWEEILGLVSIALTQIGPSKTMTSLAPLFWRLFRPRDKWSEQVLEDKLGWLSAQDGNVIDACLTEDVRINLVNNGHTLFLKGRYARASFVSFLEKCAALGSVGTEIVGRILSNMIDALLADRGAYRLEDVRFARELTSRHTSQLDRWDEFNDWFLALSRK